jgi:type I restriction enzyme S subunit
VTQYKETEIGKIPIEWTEVKFKDILVGSTSNGIYKQKQFHGTGTKIVNMGELFANSRLSSSIHMKRINLTDKEAERFCLISGDLLFARRSLTAEGAGKCSIAQDITEPVTYESSIICARPDTSKVDSHFLYYLFNSPVGKYLLTTILRQVAVSGITGKDLQNLIIHIPPLLEQKTISQTLSVLDDKIELNHQMNKTLEEMGQALFKRWFVDFDFPDETGKPYKSSGGEMVDSELGEIPKGWEVGELNELADITTGKRPSESIEVRDSSFNIPLIGASKIMGFVKTPIFSTPVLIIGRVGTHGVVQRFVTPTFPSDNTLVIQSKYFEYTYQILKKVDYDAFNVGSTQPLITQTSMREYKILIPPEKLLNEYEILSASFFHIVQENELNTDTLIKIRDSLLPKLMSGEVRVPAGA